MRHELVGVDGEPFCKLFVNSPASVQASNHHGYDRNLFVDHMSYLNYFIEIND